MRKDTIKIIQRYKEGDKNAILEIVDMFKPLIDKYSRILDGDDTRQDLIVHIIKGMEKVNISNEDFIKEKVIVSYMSKVIKNEYIRLSKMKSKQLINETELNLELEIIDNYKDDEFEMIDNFKILTEKEAYIMKLIYLYSLSVSEVAQYMKISRQAVNQSKKRALKKIKILYKQLEFI